MDDLEKVLARMSECSLVGWKFYLNESFAPGTLVVSRDVYEKIKKAIEDRNA